MARKRKIFSSLKGSGKKARKSMVVSSRKKYRTGRTRLRPEVKYVNWAFSDIGIKNFKGTAQDLAVAEIKKLITYPAQGTTDTTRIGDTIMGKKLYVRFTLFTTDTQSLTNCLVRVIIFNLKFDLGASVVGFWQAPNSPNSIQGIVNREVVNKVFYDKTFNFDSNINNRAMYQKPKNINISMRWPVIFPGGSQVPKDPRNVILFTVVGYSVSAAAAIDIASYHVSSNFYFTDS